MFRYGQTKPVNIYRLVAASTLEHDIYVKQVLKTTLANRVVDDKAQERSFHNSSVCCPSGDF